MRILAPLILIIFCAAQTRAEDQAYTASTLAAPIVRSFLGIPLTDSIDFIRWELTFTDHQYALRCQYGVSKPNTNGFMNGGKRVELRGAFIKEKNYYQLQSGARTLRFAEVNNNLLHILDSKDNLLVGNGGWSYALNNVTPTVSDQLNLPVKQTALKDSIAFHGRTPCGIPGIMASDRQCYKLKWLIVLYANAKANQPGTYSMKGTPWYEEGGRKGTWKMLTGKDNRIIYQLNDQEGKGFIYLVKLDENVLAFTDASGNLLVGDLDFSYNLNRRW